MKRIPFLVLAAAVLPTAAMAQASVDDILLAAPAQLRAEATVIDLVPDGSIKVLRQGSNGLMCWDNAGRPGYDRPVDFECTVEANRPRLEQNHKFQTAGGSADAIAARFDEAESNETRAESEFGSVYFRVRGTAVDDIMPHMTVAVPYATAESLGVPSRPSAGMLWIMQGGTSSAHLMVPNP